MQPPSAPSARPANTPSDDAWSAFRLMAPTSMAAPAETRQNTRMIAAAASGSPHETLNTVAVSTTTNIACSSATRNRPSVSPRMMVVMAVGVDTMRRETPSRLVSTSCPAAVIEVRNVNRRSWVWAPKVNWVKPGEHELGAHLLDRDRHAGDVGPPGLGHRVGLVVRACAEPLRRPGRGHQRPLLGHGRLDRRPEARW